MVLETVAVDTPANLATSLMVTNITHPLSESGLCAPGFVKQ